MNLYKISLLSIQRQLGKRFFLLSSMALSLTAVLALVTFVRSQELSIEKQFDEYGANIVVMPRRDDLSLSYGGVNISSVVTHLEELNALDIQQIYNIPNHENIRAVSPKLIGAVTVKTNETEENVLLVGVNMEEERKIKSWWDIEGLFPQNKGEVLVGSDVALSLGLALQDEIIIDETALRVAGIIKATGSQDDRVILGHMSQVEEILARPGQISLIDVSALCSDCPIDEMVSQISQALPDADVKAIRQVMNQRMEMVQRFNRFALSLGLLIALLCAFLTFAVMTASVAERHREIGIFRALGFSGKNILQIIQTETLLISLAAGLLGIGLSSLVSLTLLPRLTGLSLAEILISPVVSLAGFTALMVLSLLASLGPALKAARIDPVESMNSL
ncbi:MAG: ABC transporter permease [Spirochaetaceae bacterium]|jgi:putative ABC transport system permease protein|nr:ABC transporter permease [Spirochaetaceae bacterium]